jgi:hypothetical protein
MQSLEAIAREDITKTKELSQAGKLKFPSEMCLTLKFMLTFVNQKRYH